MKKTCNRDTNSSQNSRRLLIYAECLITDIGSTNCQGAIYRSSQCIQQPGLSLQFVSLYHKELSINEPDFSYDDEPVDCNHDSERGNSGSEMWRKQRLNG